MQEKAPEMMVLRTVVSGVACVSYCRRNRGLVSSVSLLWE